MGLAWFEKRLENLVHSQQFAKRLGSILCPLVTVKSQSLWCAAAVNGTLESRCNQAGTILGRNPVCDHFSWKEVYDDADIHILLIDLKADNVADPDVVWLGYLKFPLQNVMLFSILILFYNLVRVDGNTLKPNFPHQLRHIFRRGVDTLIRQYDSYFMSLRLVYHTRCYHAWDIPNVNSSNFRSDVQKDKFGPCIFFVNTRQVISYILTLRRRAEM